MIKVNALFPVVLSVVLIVLVASLSAPSQKKPNQTPALGQITGGDSSITCPGPSGTYGNTDLTLTLPTTGKPVLVTFYANAVLSTNTGINMRPTIDGSAVDAQTIQHFVGEGETASLSFSRFYSVPQGTHDFRAQFSCQGSVSVGQRWMIVQELN